MSERIEPKPSAKWWDLPVLALLLLCPPFLGHGGLRDGRESLWDFLFVQKRMQMPEFSWPYFFLLCLVCVVVLSPAFIYYLKSTSKSGPEPTRRAFPWWGYLSLGLLVLFWVLAWNRFAWFAPMQIHTFIGLWFSFIVFINALNYARSSRSFLTHQTRDFVILFLASSVFWWYFEYLNGFVYNWYYLLESQGLSVVEALGVTHYAIFASVSFATVLPGVMSITAYLKSFSGFSSRFTGWGTWQVHSPRLVGASLLILALSTLTLISIFPFWLYPLVWLSPFFVLLGYQLLMGRGSVLDPAMRGDWRNIIISAIATLICGFFWEMWNHYSDAKWIYQVPYVSRFYLFEMPIMGFAGYLPFGVACLAISEFVLNERSEDEE